MASAMWFHGYEHGIDLGQHRGIIHLQYPAFLGRIVLVENAQAECLATIRSATSPCLKSTRVLDPRFLVQIVGVKNERLPFCVEHATVRLLRFSSSGNVVDFCDVEIAGSHEFADITILGQKLVLLIKSSVAVV